MVGKRCLACLLILGPIVAVLLTAVGDSGGLWEHLYETVLGRYVANTLILMMGVGLLAIGFGVSSAWVIDRYDFLGRRMLEWMLLLPAAIPAYIIAYTYTEFFEYAGPLQSALRHMFLVGKAEEITGSQKFVLLEVLCWLWHQFYIPISTW